VVGGGGADGGAGRQAALQAMEEVQAVLSEVLARDPLLTWVLSISLLARGS
jgi:hypothetical protein